MKYNWKQLRAEIQKNLCSLNNKHNKANFMVRFVELWYANYVSLMGYQEKLVIENIRQYDILLIYILGGLLICIKSEK